jgi:hypothetical protein
MHRLITDRSARALLAVVWAVAAGCTAHREHIKPSIEFTTVPEAAPGGPYREATIAGRVTGARRGQKIVLFAKSGGWWWLQGPAKQPLTEIEADSTWNRPTHLGTDYAALLVESGYRPPDTTYSLPRAGDGVVTVATVEGTGNFGKGPRKALSFSGYQWDVRNIPSNRGGDNDYDTANAWTDAEGCLHLMLAWRDSRWTSAEVILGRTLGYGTYIFTTRDTSSLDPAAVFGMFTWDDEGADQSHRELDVEISRFGDLNIPDAEYVIQPYYVAVNVARFMAPPGPLTHSFRWEPDRASFRTVRGRRAGVGAIVSQHEFTSGVPIPGSERVRMNLYFFRDSPTPPRKDVEVVIERFQYLP